MYNVFSGLAERWLRIPPQPEAPPGDEGTMQQFRAAPNFYKYLLFLWAIKSLVLLFIVCMSTGLPIVIATFALLHEGKQWAWLLLLIPGVTLSVVILISMFLLAVLRLEFDKRWYMVTDRSLRIREGVIGVREMTVTFANIQNISISEGPIQRALGIADLRVDTAGGGGATQGNKAGPNLHTAWFRGINNANEVRALIQTRLRHLKDSGLGDHEEMVRSAPSPNRESLLRALTEVHAAATAMRRTVEARA